MTKGAKVSEATRAKMRKAQRARYAKKPTAKRPRKAKRVNWKKTVARVEAENVTLRNAAAATTAKAEVLSSFADALLEHVREEIRDMIREELDALEVHVGF